MKTYKDRVKVSQRNVFELKLPGETKSIKISSIKYQVRGAKDSKTKIYKWHNVKNPKTIFEGSGDENLKAFEEQMIPHLIEAFKKAPSGNRLVRVEVPVKGFTGKNTKIYVQVARDPDNTGKTFGRITSWWISETNGTNLNLKKQ